MSTRSRWDETRAIIEADQRRDYWGNWWCRRLNAAAPIDWDEVKRAQHDGSRQIYGGLGTAQRED